MDNQPRIKTPGEHHRDMLAIARQHVALACARSLCEPDDQRWPNVITRLVDWMQRLQQGDPRLLERDNTRLLERDNRRLLERDNRRLLTH